MKKSILIISVGPVPTGNDTIVEGGGLRAWGIAKGLLENNIKVTIAVPDNFQTKTGEVQADLSICQWSFNNLKSLMSQHDCVYVLYSRPDLMKFVAENIPPERPLVVDLYVPIYIEILARETRKDIVGLKQHLLETSHWNTAFPRGDFFMCANKNQLHFYRGILSAFGRVNPITFKEELLKIIPYGIHREKLAKKKNVCKEKIINKDDFMILWFGGIYPWFDINPLLASIKDLHRENSKIKLFILGGRNPFAVLPEFIEKYESVLKYTKKQGMYEKSVFFVDWIPFEERGEWYQEADLIVNLHDLGDESTYAWRTRLVDFIWGETPILTSGRDELSKMVFEKRGAVILKNNSFEEITKNIKALVNDPKKLESMKNGLVKMKDELYWDILVKDLAVFIERNEIAPDRKILLKAGTTFQAELFNTPNNQKKVNATHPLKKKLSYSLYILKNEGLKKFSVKLKRYLSRKIKRI